MSLMRAYRDAKTGAANGGPVKIPFLYGEDAAEFDRSAKEWDAETLRRQRWAALEVEMRRAAMARNPLRRLAPRVRKARPILP